VFPLGCMLRTGSSPPNFFTILLTSYHIDNAYISQQHAANQHRLLSHVTLCLLECSK